MHAVAQWQKFCWARRSAVSRHESWREHQPLALSHLTQVSDEYDYRFKVEAAKLLEEVR